MTFLFIGRSAPKQWKYVALATKALQTAREAAFVSIITPPLIRLKGSVGLRQSPREVNENRIKNKRKLLKNFGFFPENTGCIPLAVVNMTTTNGINRTFSRRLLKCVFFIQFLIFSELSLTLSKKCLSTPKVVFWSPSASFTAKLIVIFVTVQIPIGLLKEPTDLDLHCLKMLSVRYINMCTDLKWLYVKPTLGLSETKLWNRRFAFARIGISFAQITFLHFREEKVFICAKNLTVHCAKHF